MARILTAAGFTAIAITPFDASVPFGTGQTRDAAIDDAVKIAIENGPLARALAVQPDEVRAPEPRFVPPSRVAPASDRC
jgi:hypothetical protein